MSQPPQQAQDPVVEALRAEVAALRGLLEAQASQLQATIGELSCSSYSRNGGTRPCTASERWGPLAQKHAAARRLQGQGRLGAVAFQAESCLAVVDTRYPLELEVARKTKTPLQMADMTEDVRTMSVRLFGVLGSWTQDSVTAVKLARGVKGK